MGALEDPGHSNASPNDVSARGKVAWLLPGQGAQRLGMGRQLAAEWPAFGAAFDEACEALDTFMQGRPLKEVMWSEPGTEEAALLDQTAYTQPALFAVGVALGALWRSWGVEPDLLLGHSIGELVAARLAGVFSLEDAARLVSARARGMQALPAGGAMVAIAASEAEVAASVLPHAGGVSVAAVNGPRSVVISGDAQTVLAHRGKERGSRVFGEASRDHSQERRLRSELDERARSSVVERRYAVRKTNRIADMPNPIVRRRDLRPPERSTQVARAAHLRLSIDDLLRDRAKLVQHRFHPR